MKKLLPTCILLIALTIGAIYFGRHTPKVMPALTNEAAERIAYNYNHDQSEEKNSILGSTVTHISDIENDGMYIRTSGGVIRIKAHGYKGADLDVEYSND